MTRHFTLVPTPEGHPQVRVPLDCLWDLVEYLSYQRLDTHYEYEETTVSVIFPKESVDAVRQLMHDWTHLQPANAAEFARH